MFNYSTSNIGYDYLQNLLGLRLEGFLLRIRYVVYTILIVAQTFFPLACLLTILILELTHISITFYYAARYRYAKNWFLMISKINVGVSIVAITSVGTYILLRYDNPSDFNNKVNADMQYATMILFAFSVTLEMIILTLDILVRVGMFTWAYYKKKAKQASNKYFEGSWVSEKGPLKNENDIFEDPTDTGMNRIQ